MDKKYIERPEKFDKVAYNKEHYVSFSYRIKPELKQEIDEYCADLGISKSEFLRRSLEALKELDKS